MMLRAQLTTLKLNKQELPKQPIPDLKKTAERYLTYVRIILYYYFNIFYSNEKKYEYIF